MKNSRFIYRAIVGLHIVAFIGTVWLSIFVIDKYIDGTFTTPIEFVGALAGALGLYMFIASGARHMYEMDQEKQQYLFARDREKEKRSFEEERFKFEKKSNF